MRFFVRLRNADPVKTQLKVGGRGPKLMISENKTTARARVPAHNAAYHTLLWYRTCKLRRQ